MNSEVVDLELFDYLNHTIKDTRKEKDGPIIIAGNLDVAKAGYLQEVVKCNPECNFSLYGVNYKDLKFANITYNGEYKSDVLPGILNGSWGLIWDGPSIETCEDNYGNYLKINNPNKMSLYMAAGMPVIVWTESAMAEFVKKYNVGIAVDSLKGLSEKLSAVSEDEYVNMLDNVLLQMKRVSEGYYSSRVLDLINEILG